MAWLQPCEIAGQSDIVNCSLPGEVLCCSAGQPEPQQDASDRPQAAAVILQERTAMILGMNPRTLRAKRRWSLFMWQQQRHWALVLQPVGEAFMARIVDDFVHNAQSCFSMEVPASQVFLVYELLLDRAEPFLMLSVKPDFQTDRKNVLRLGLSQRLNLLEIQAHALQAFGRYKCYSFIGANCQHFATDFAKGLGALTRINPDDETIALAATDTALPVGVVGACVAATAAVGAATASQASCAPVLNVVAASASAVSLFGCAALAGVAGMYKLLHDQNRQGSPVAGGGQMIFAQSASMCLSIDGQKLLSKSMPCLRRLETSSDTEDEELQELDRLQATYHLPEVCSWEMFLVSAEAVALCTLIAEASNAAQDDRAEFVLAGLAACGAITLTNPIDVVKTRLQLQGELSKTGRSAEKAYTGIGQALLRISRREGLQGLQRGLMAAYLLQFSNVGCRFGAYGSLKELLGVKPGASATDSLTSMLLGAASGSLAAVVSNPFFLLKQAFVEIGQAQGPRGYYRGLSAFVPRVAAATSVQLSTYDISKDLILRWVQVKEGVATHFTASLLSGIAVTLAMQPFDIVAVRLMNQPHKECGRGVLYSGPLDCLKQMLHAEGLFGLYKGAAANYVRFGPYCTLTFVFLEQLRLAWDRRFAEN
ncbi:Slc25a35 [Symbiodinium pilosum]|uniref:Slc25a35 protein n=1 Tax=Symbiodinium pilosum TaxID=2952 RepID=A0A812VX51_SYMPI|nr:Slc25a35 [Symbiodinium pilosum]